MKLNKWIYGIAAVGMLAACTHDDAPDMGPVINHDGDYMAVNIKLPTVRATRAANDNFDDGTANEYKVSNGCLVIFKGDNAESAQFAGAYNLTGLDAAAVPDDDPADQAPDQLTTSYRKTVKLDNLSYQEEQNLYAFVMLNYTGVAELTRDQSGNYDNGITVNGMTLVRAQAKTETTDAVEGTTFSEAFLQITTNELNMEINGEKTNFFMCNAPLSNVMGGTSGLSPTDNDIVILTEIDKTKIYPTKEEAEYSGSDGDNSACSVNVERAMAKATLDWDPVGFNNKNIASIDNNSISFEVIGWALDVEEPSSYIARNVAGAEWWDYVNDEAGGNKRFVGSDAVGTTSIQPEQSLYRTYWCYDPHYDKDIFDEVEHSNPTNFVDKGKALYCRENTFNVGHQNYKNTTRAVFKVTLKFDGVDSKSNFYVLNGDESSIYTKEADVESYPRSVILESSIIDQALKDALKENESYDAKVAAELVEISFERTEVGFREVKDVKFNDLSDRRKVSAETAAKFAKQPVLDAPDAEGNPTYMNRNILIAQANTEYVITEYVGGDCYYDLRFMHFANDSNEYPDDLAPWKIDSQVATTVEDAYPGANAAQQWLGRYGMVRNNWYNIEVTGVSKLGSPVVPDVNGSRGDTSDDSKENYISFKVNVMSWAKRSQKHEF